MVTCWASGLGGCSSRQSGEHYATRGLWSASSITISGFGWQGGQAKQLPVGSLEANILCTTHNNLLGEQVDAEAIRIFRTIGEVVRIFQEWQANPPRKKPLFPKRYSADGKLFERWTAKTLIDFVCVESGSGTVWHHSGSPAIEPSIEVVSAIYGNTTFERPMGLYLAQESTHDPQVVLQEAVRVDPRFHPAGGGLVGGFVEFRNVRFLIWLIDEPFDSFVTETRSGATFGAGKDQVHYHLDELKIGFNGPVRHKILFAW